MREVNLLDQMPQPENRIVGSRTIEHRIIASYREREFFDGDRNCGYGGYVDDGRWGPVAERMIEYYKLKEGSSITQVNCEKGFLLGEFDKRGMAVIGHESSVYARHCADPNLKIYDGIYEEDIRKADLLIAIGRIYTGSLKQAIDALRQTANYAFQSFITLAAYESEDDLRLLRKWSLLGTTILRKDEWVEVMKHANYTGDYSFVTARTLRLCETTGVF
jgi:protein-L-isoaspartate(D-aspartate) O-methyltransferase